jgi:hypothetical protein
MSIFKEISQTIYSFVSNFYVSLGWSASEVDAALQKIPYIRDAWK